MSEYRYELKDFVSAVYNSAYNGRVVRRFMDVFDAGDGSPVVESHPWYELTANGTFPEAHLQSGDKILMSEYMGEMEEL